MPVSESSQYATATATATSPAPGKLRVGSPVTREAKTTSEQFLPTDAKRSSASVYNDSNSVLYLDYFAEVSATQHMVSIAPGQLWESPNTCTDNIYGAWVAPASPEVLSGRAHVRSFVVR